MEAGGLAILPKRLISELQEIIDIFDPNNLDLILQNENLTKHYL
jgi:galactose-1-phosphate uridylyltransferase